MPRVSAGLLMYRFHDGKLQVLLAHPGGPFFKNNDEGAWTIPKAGTSEIQGQVWSIQYVGPSQGVNLVAVPCVVFDWYRA